MEMLEAIVHSAPKELDDFIRHILDSIPSRYCRYAFVLLALTMRLNGALLSDQKVDPRYEIYLNLASEIGWDLNLLSYSCLLEGLDRGTLAQSVKEVPTDFPTGLETSEHRIE